MPKKITDEERLIRLLHAATASGVRLDARQPAL